MPRVVIKRTDSKLEEAGFGCPCNCFRKSANGEFVIDPNDCIDCGVCQTIVDEGVILEDSEAGADDINFNKQNADKWDPVQ